MNRFIFDGRVNTSKKKPHTKRKLEFVCFECRNHNEETLCHKLPVMCISYMACMFCWLKKPSGKSLWFGFFSLTNVYIGKLMEKWVHVIIIQWFQCAFGISSISDVHWWNCRRPIFHKFTECEHKWFHLIENRWNECNFYAWKEFILWVDSLKFFVDEHSLFCFVSEYDNYEPLQ